MSTMLKCTHCGSYDIDQDPARGDAACVDCGTVLEQNLIVSEVGFSEDARGRSNMIGQHVRADGRPMSFGAMPGYSRQATELTLSNGRRRIVQIVSALKLSSHHTDAAHRLFKLAVERNFHKGRRLSNVCCACLYVVCRTEKTPHMLLDFADVLETNVYVLGHTFLKFTKLLSLQLPIIDPSLYIHRFASKLEFGHQTHVVAITALRIVARMHRDWMSHGRRPSSLCGAALMCAAGIHHFHRSMLDICRVVRVGNVALRERLQELNRTPTAALTVAQIDAGGGDDGNEDSLAPTVAQEACDPPAFQRAQKLKELVAKRKRIEGGGGEKAHGEGEEGDAGSRKRVRFMPREGGRTAEDEALEQQMEKVLASDELQELERETEEEERLDANARARQEKAKAIGDDREGNGDARAVVDTGEISEEDVNLSDLDDEDTAKYLNTEEEYERKKEMWTEINKEYLERQERLETMKRERPEEYKRLRPWRSSQTKKKRSGDKAKKDAPAETTPKTPPPPKQSKKINYNVLRSLSGSGGLGLLRGTGASADRPPRPPRATN